MFLTGYISAFVFPVNGQNLVPNPGFEHYSSCPVFASQLDSAVPWFNPSAGTPEFYHACAAYSSGVSVPQQYTGGFQYARTGSGYAGLFTYRTDIPDMREYAEISLQSPLVAGSCYYFEMYVNQPNNFSVVTDGFGALLVEGEYHLNSGKVINKIPQIDNPAGNLLQDSAGWMKISGYFTAKGGENHLIIGNFRDDVHTIHSLFNPSCWYLNCAYLLVDDILLTPFNIELDLGSDTILCEGTEIVLSAGNAGSSWTWNTGSTLPDLVVNQEGIYWVEAGLGSCRVRDSIRIGYLAAPPARLPDDTVLCVGEELFLNAAVWQANYLWSDNTVNPGLLVSKPGIYWVNVSNQCGENTDSITISMTDCYCSLIVPNVFTPNADQVNDVFKPLIDCRLSDYQLTIYNRWGTRVFSTGNPDTGWNGQINSNAAASGTYFWQISYSGNNNGKSVNFSKNGTLALIRNDQ